MTVPTDETLLVVDGHSLAFRAFFALPVDNFSTSSGQATNAVWGFATMLAQVIDAEKPDHLGVAFDVKGGTFRNEMLPQYKGTREAAPEELLTQLPLIQRMLTALGVTYIEKPGFEGDDVIATLATMGDKAGYHTLVLSGDRDAFQLVDDNVTVLYPGHHFKDLKHMTPQSIIDKYKVTPAQYPDLAALRGETADNIPGVPGVGDGFAAKWINQFGSLDGICEHADEIGGKKGESLRANIDQVKLNRKVNALVRDVDLGVDIEDLTFGTVDVAQIDALFKELEFGPRTKSRVLKTFNIGAKASNTSGAGESTNNEQDEQDCSGAVRRMGQGPSRRSQGSRRNRRFHGFRLWRWLAAVCRLRRRGRPRLDRGRMGRRKAGTCHGTSHCRGHGNISGHSGPSNHRYLASTACAVPGKRTLPHHRAWV